MYDTESRWAAFVMQTVSSLISAPRDDNNQDILAQSVSNKSRLHALTRLLAAVEETIRGTYSHGAEDGNFVVDRSSDWVHVSDNPLDRILVTPSGMNYLAVSYRRIVSTLAAEASDPEFPLLDIAESPVLPDSNETDYETSECKTYMTPSEVTSDEAVALNRKLIREKIDCALAVAMASIAESLAQTRIGGG